MAILDSRNVGSKQAAPLLDVTLRQVLYFTDGAYAFTDEHGGFYRSCGKSFPRREFAADLVEEILQEEHMVLRLLLLRRLGRH